MAAQSVLILGGSGQAGSGAASVLRRWYPDLPLVIAGRDLDRARRVAEDLGTARAVTVDMTRADLGLPDEPAPAAVVATLWDSRLHGLRYAQQHRAGYLSISNGLVDIAPEVVAGAQQSSAAPVLLASHYLAGLGVLTALHRAADFDHVETLRFGAVLDDTDTGGPAGMADLDRLVVATESATLRRDGVFTWLAASDAQAVVRSVDGTTLPGQSIAILDVPSTALATGAPNVRFDLAVGESAGRRAGGAPSTELGILLEGTDRSGGPRRTHRYLQHPQGQRPLTALGIALGVERLLGLRGSVPTPGIHTPESLIDPSYAVDRMREIGATFTDVPTDQQTSATAGRTEIAAGS
ncbi:saccharopine dehydrogenase [Nocardia sp. NPDC048505]|uniref:saccharopine dehydrogenase n=1 Tax=unclassified Nocardia TaxID=2637762 RepID=UPI0033F0D815